MLSDKIREIECDRSSGASQIARNALDVLRFFAQTNEIEACSEFKEDFRNIGMRLFEARPNMAPVQNLIAQIVYEVSMLEEDDFSSVRNFALSRIEELCRQSMDAVGESAKRGAALIGEYGCVASCSYSSTVCETFRIAKQEGKFFEVIVAESKSGDGRFVYGQTLADFLESIDVSVEVFADAEVYRFVPQADCVLVGADSVLCDGSVINGSPTYVVAVKAKEHGIPVYSVCETTKANTLSYLGKQVKPKKGFDNIPANLISGIVTEKGILDANKLNAVMKERSKFFEVFHAK